MFFSLKGIFGDGSSADPVATLFGMGEPNPPEYTRYFIGKSYVNMLLTPTETSNYLAANVTFEREALARCGERQLVRPSGGGSRRTAG